MLARAERRRIDWGSSIDAFVQGDFFEQDFEKNAYDTVSRLLSESPHGGSRTGPVRCVPDHAQRVRTISHPGFGVEPGASEIQHQGGMQARRLNDGTAFEIYKRYCDREDLSRWVREYDVTLRVEHFGSAFYAVSGAFD
jgi:hypothetical protein